MKPTILHITKYYYPIEGGIETVTKNMAEGLSDYDNIVVCFSYDNTTRLDTINHVKVYRIATTFKLSSQDIAPTYYHHLKTIIQRHQPAILLLHCPNPFLYPIVCHLKPSTSKLVLLWHSDILGKGLLYTLIRSVEAKLLRQADLILTTSPHYIHPSSPIYPHRHKTRVVPNGINTADFALTADEAEKVNAIRQRYHNKPIILFIGRHVKYKGIDHLLRAERHIQSDCILLIGGSGPETSHLRNQPHAARVHFLGRIPAEALKYYYYAATLFSFPSTTKQEAFGVTLLEAMYCHSVPITFTIAGSGVNWVSVKGETGEEVPLGDEKAYAAAIDRLLTDQTLRQRYAEEGRKRVEEIFTCEKANQEAAMIFKELLHG